MGLPAINCAPTLQGEAGRLYCNGCSWSIVATYQQVLRCIMNNYYDELSTSIAIVLNNLMLQLWRLKSVRMWLSCINYVCSIFLTIHLFSRYYNILSASALLRLLGRSVGRSVCLSGCPSVSQSVSLNRCALLRLCYHTNILPATDHSLSRADRMPSTRSAQLHLLLFTTDE